MKKMKSKPKAKKMGKQPMSKAGKSKMMKKKVAKGLSS